MIAVITINLYINEGTYKLAQVLNIIAMMFQVFVLLRIANVLIKDQFMISYEDLSERNKVFVWWCCYEMIIVFAQICSGALFLTLRYFKEESLSLTFKDIDLTKTTDHLDAEGVLSVYFTSISSPAFATLLLVSIVNASELTIESKDIA